MITKEVQLALLTKANSIASQLCFLAFFTMGIFFSLPFFTMGIFFLSNPFKHLIDSFASYMIWDGESGVNVIVMDCGQISNVF